MKELNCAVARDLLPLHAEELLSTETAALLDAHLADCPACRETLARMKAEVTVCPVKPAAPARQVRRYLIGLRVWYLLCPFIAFVLLYFGWTRAAGIYMGVIGVLCAVCIASQFLSGATMGGIDYEQVRLKDAAERRSRKRWGGFYVSPIEIALPALLPVCVVLVNKLVKYFGPVLARMHTALVATLLSLPVVLALLWIVVHLINKRMPK